MPPVISIRLQPSDLVRITPQRKAGGGGRWLLIDDLNSLHVAEITAGDVIYRRSDFESVPWAITTTVTTTGKDSEPRFAIWKNRRILLVWTRATDSSQNVWTATSHSDGGSFAAETMLFAGGKHPTINTGRDQELMVACYMPIDDSSGFIQAQHQYPGDTDLSDPYPFVDLSGATILVEDDGFHFAPAAGVSRLWAMLVRVLGEPGSSLWLSSAPELGTWRRVA